MRRPFRIIVLAAVTLKTDARDEAASGIVVSAGGKSVDGVENTPVPAEATGL